MKRNPRVRPRPEHDKPETWLRRGEVAKLLNVGKDAVRYYETSGALHPRQDATGEWRFDPEEVYAYAMTHPKVKKRTDDEIEAAAFELFEQGADRRRVVIALRITVARAQKLWEDWQTADFEVAARSEQEQEARAKREREEREKDEQRRARLARTQAILGRLGAATPTPRR